MDVKKYTAGNKDDWDAFVKNSINGTFLIQRDYMEYHKHLFEDHSLMVFYKKKLIAIFPSNEAKGTIYSHRGLTYGGVILNGKATTSHLLQIFKAINDYYIATGFKKVIYKAIPHTYHKSIAETDLYCLFRIGARMISRNLASVIYLPDKRIQYDNSRKNGLRKCRSKKVIVSQSKEFNMFWEILEENLLVKYRAKPVHSIDEIKYLNGIFPEKIKLFGATINNKMIAGVVIYETEKVARVQYISASKLGKESCALDMIFDRLINECYAESSQQYIDFGTSTYEDGMVLNEPLIFQKEGFGARGINYDVYEYDLKNN